MQCRKCNVMNAIKWCYGILFTECNVAIKKWCIPYNDYNVMDAVYWMPWNNCNIMMQSYAINFTKNDWNAIMHTLMNVML